LGLSGAVGVYHEYLIVTVDLAREGNPASRQVERGLGPLFGVGEGGGLPELRPCGTVSGGGWDYEIRLVRGRGRRS
jgi:hypothetical protein